jgi:pimeloyl-ACP methyl ester carboxylesterase
MKTLIETLPRETFTRLESLLICLLLSHLATAARAQAPVELTSISSTTNGVSMAWTDPGPGQAYTVQVRESLTSGAWRNGTTRYRWPWPFTHWGDAPRSLPAARFYRVLAQAAATPNRGRLLTSLLRDQFDTNSLNTYFAAQGVKDFVHPKFGTANRPFTYETVDPYGLSITASALLILPRGTNGPLPLVTVQHGTLAQKIYAPSQSEQNTEYMWGVVFASYGYAVVMPDYLGLGSSPGYQAYTHAQSEATCVVDALRAGRSLCASNNVTLNGQLFLTGYSQGGQVTMAAHRELETFHTNEFTVTASAPCAGPYDLGGVTIEGILANPAYPRPLLFALILASYLPIYQLGDTLEELLAEPYRQTLPPLLDGAHDFGQIAAAMPADMFAILRPDFQADFRTNVSNPLRQAFLDNNTYSWTPKAPVTMFHCQGDDVVNFANAEVAYQSFTNRGACCVSVVDPGAPAQLNHDDCYIPSLRGVLTWFESLRQ